MFDVAERRGWIKTAADDAHFLQAEFRFPESPLAGIVASWALIAIGMMAVYFRGSQLLDIDFTGGSSVTFTLNDSEQDVAWRSSRRTAENRAWPRRTCSSSNAAITNTSYSRRYQRAIGRRRERT